MKGVLRMFIRGDRCTLLAGASGKQVEKFRHFRDFLAGNRNALRALAELEMLYYGGQSFTAADVAFQYEQLVTRVRALVAALQSLSGNRYALLTPQADAINAQVCENCYGLWLSATISPQGQPRGVARHLGR